MATRILLILTVIFSLGSFALGLKNAVDIKSLGCDVRSGFEAERIYTYPILRTIDDPGDYGKGIYNPLMMESKYLDGCS